MSINSHGPGRSVRSDFSAQATHRQWITHLAKTWCSQSAIHDLAARPADLF